jgi:hypothetical protein
MRCVLAVAVVVATGVGCNDSRNTPVAPVEPPPPVTQPTPTPEPSPAMGCGLPRGTGLGRGCPRTHESFAGEVDAAIDKVVKEHPEWFDFRRARGSPTSYRVRVEWAYYDGVVNNLRAMRLCALDDGKEIAVKNDNSFSDQYQIYSSDGFIIRGLASYRATCYPAWDAIPP